MKVMKTVSRVAYSVALAIGLAVITISILTVFKVLNPLIVVSGSMEPSIPTGALLLATETSAGNLSVGDVAALPRSDGMLVTHRVTTVEPVPGVDKLWSITMKGDANEIEDIESYVQQTALTPRVTIPLAGYVVGWISNNRFTMISILCFGTGLYFAAKMLMDRWSRKERPAVRKSADRGTTQSS